MASAEILQHLTGIVESPLFSRSQRHCGLLKFLVMETLEGRAHELKESVIAMQVFGRSGSYDPQVDASVRVEIGRLRTRLQAYYGGAGANAPVRIDIPTGSYAVVFSKQTPDAALPKRRLPRSWGLIAVMVALAVLGSLSVGLHAFVFKAAANSGYRRNPQAGIAMALSPFTATGAIQERLATGIAHELRNSLPGIPHLRMVGDSMAKPSDLRRLAVEWQARLVLAGAIDVDNGSVYVQAHLTDAASGEQVWSTSRKWARDPGIRLETGIAKEITTEIHLKLLGQDAALPERYRKAEDAYRLYTEGLLLHNEHVEAAVRAGAGRFSDALVADAAFAPALAALSDSRLRLFELRADVPEWDGGAVAAKALEMDPELGEAHLAVASVLALHDRNWPAAERHFLRAMQLKPNDPRPRLRYALAVLVPQQRFEEAAEQIGRARQLDPLSTEALVGAATVEFYRGNFHLARELYQEALDIDTDNLWLRASLAASLIELGAFDKAEITLKRGVVYGCSHCLSVMACMYGRMGNRVKAYEVLSALNQRRGKSRVAAYDLARAYSGLGEEQTTVLRYLAAAAEQRSVLAVQMPVDPAFRGLRSHPRFQDILASMELPAPH